MTEVDLKIKMYKYYNIYTFFFLNSGENGAKYPLAGLLWLVN